MKTELIVSSMLLAIAAGRPALADKAQEDQTAQYQRLGRLDGLLTICSAADPGKKAGYERVRSELIVFGKGTRYELDAPGTNTQAFKDGQAEIQKAAGKVGQEDLVAACRAFLAGKVAKDE